MEQVTAALSKEQSGSSLVYAVVVYGKKRREPKPNYLPAAGTFFKQFQDGRPIPAVSQVIEVFPEHATGWELAYFFVTANPNIGGCGFRKF
jgi:hypothetical protein